MQAFSSMQWHTQRSTENMAKLGSALTRFRQRLLAAAFAGMHAHGSRKGQQRRMAVRALAYWKGSVTVAAFCAWSERTRRNVQTKEKVQCYTVLSRCEHTPTCSCVGLEELVMEMSELPMERSGFPSSCLGSRQICF